MPYPINDVDNDINYNMPCGPPNAPPTVLVPPHNPLTPTYSPYATIRPGSGEGL